MIIAAAVMSPELDAVIPETLEEAAGLLLVETDDMSIAKFEESRWVSEMIAQDCEAILCGQMYDAQLFEAIAGACITRYFAAGMTVRDAVNAMNAYRLDIIRDYVDGPGCSGEDHNTSEGPCECSCGKD